jgi:hypothetical protein
MVDHVLDDPVDGGFVGVVAAHDIDDLAALRPACLVQHVDERQGHLFFLDVDAQRFADIRRPVIKKVVANLESHADFFAHEAHLLDERRIVRPRACGSDFAATRNQRRGLLPDDIKIHRLIDIQLSGLFDLQQFALGHEFDGIAGNLEQLKIVVLHGHEQALAQQEVADQDGNLVFPEGVDAEKAAAFVGIVHDIVVDEGGGMEQFDEGCTAVGAWGDAAGEIGAEQTNIGRICLPLRLMRYCMILSSSITRLFIAPRKYFSNCTNSSAMGACIVSNARFFDIAPKLGFILGNARLIDASLARPDGFEFTAAAAHNVHPIRIAFQKSAQASILTAQRRNATFWRQNPLPSHLGFLTAEFQEMTVRHWFLSLLLLSCQLSALQAKYKTPAVAPELPSIVNFVENKGQWDSYIRYEAGIPWGKVFFEDGKLTYNLADLSHLHDDYFHCPTNRDLTPINYRGHAFQLVFEGANGSPSMVTAEKYPQYNNYFIGNDPSKWAGAVGIYGEIRYEGLYPGIDAIFYGQKDALKYDFVVSAGSDAQQIRLKYEGLEGIRIEDGDLVFPTSIGTFKEMRPFAYQVIDGVQVGVECHFVLENSVVTFAFPQGYRHDLELVIDPTWVFGSFTGSTADNFGYTATFDTAGNLYGGGIAFALGYPTSIGAYQTALAAAADHPSADCPLTCRSPNSIPQAPPLSGAHTSAAPSTSNHNP